MNNLGKISFVVYDNDGKIVKVGFCADFDFQHQPLGSGEHILAGIGNSVSHKVVDGKIINKTQEEIEADKLLELKPIPNEQQPAIITNKQYQSILSRLGQLEKGE